MPTFRHVLRARRHVPRPDAPTLAAINVQVSASDDEDDPAPLTHGATAPLAKLPAAVPAPPASVPTPAPGWHLARPLCETAAPRDADDNAQQLAILAKARSMHATCVARIPADIDRSGAIDPEKGYRIHREGGGHVSVSAKGHPLAVAEGLFDVHFVDTWQTDIVLRVSGLGTGFIPLMAMMHEPDLVADYLPHPSGLPHIESLEFAKTFAENDWMYRCFVSPFGPLPGADDLHAITLFDLLDEPERAILFYAESPSEGTDTHRGWAVPPVKGWRRKRNYVLGATCIMRPSNAKPIEVEPPTATPAKCASPGCNLRVNSALSSGWGGLYCCGKCREKPCKHGSSCERCEFSSAASHKWDLATHGCVDLEISITLKLPIPTWMIPLAFLRWVLVKVIKLYYPYLLALNERFYSTPFAQRVKDDVDGFYERLRRTIKSPTRPWHRKADAEFVLDG